MRCFFSSFGCLVILALARVSCFVNTTSQPAIAATGTHCRCTAAETKPRCIKLGGETDSAIR